MQSKRAAATVTLHALVHDDQRTDSEDSSSVDEEACEMGTTEEDVFRSAPPKKKTRLYSCSIDTFVVCSKERKEPHSGFKNAS